ncbi:MAG: cytochrome c oxidase subunit II [Chitinophagaceae bacterium]|jgi:cytochrome c oxidase subunit 2|nr:cytochrome c oxidase subunit II [Chitinophagaceae bacterium]OQY92440.1 MAG: cytochrome c oxidase subunit II [Sphingobacteriales bacterium UTBCD1]
MQTFFIVAILFLGFLITFQIAKTSEYVSVLKGEEKSRRQSNRINAFLLLAFLIIGLFGVYYCNEVFKGRLLYVSASYQGESIDKMMWITTAITGFVFIITHIALFWFAFKYQESDKRKAYFFPHSTKLEVIWTVVPSITLTIMIGFGLYYWFKITGEAPKNAMVVEVTGSQFQWDFRYPGPDKVLGKKYYKDINPAANNPLGQVWDDPANHDDIHATGEVHVVVNKPVKFIIGSKDVIHDVGLVHFRMKMDAVPGTPTTMWFTPKYTTKQMKEITGNPDFVYEISCDQMCGKGHWSMRGVVIVETQEEFDTWMFSQKPQYYVAFPDKDPSNPAYKPDSTAAGNAAISTGNNKAKTRQ